MWRTAALERTLLVSEQDAHSHAVAAAAEAFTYRHAAGVDSASGVRQLWAAARAAVSLLPAAGSQRIRGAAAQLTGPIVTTYLPLLLLPALLAALQRRLAAATLEGSGGDDVKSRQRWSLKANTASQRRPWRPAADQGTGSRALTALQRLVLWSSYACVTLHWLWEDSQAALRGDRSEVCKTATLANAWQLASRCAAQTQTKLLPHCVLSPHKVFSNPPAPHVASVTHQPQQYVSGVC